MVYRDRFPDCPVCDVPLEGLRLITGHWITSCPQCEGSWITRAIFDELCATLAPDQDVPDLIARQAQRREPQQRLRAHVSGLVQPMACPVCHRQMAKKECDAVPIDECSDHGIWFDWGELQQVLSTLGHAGK